MGRVARMRKYPHAEGLLRLIDQSKRSADIHEAVTRVLSRKNDTELEILEAVLGEIEMKRNERSQKKYPGIPRSQTGGNT
jgi:predicted hydrolase (HD superfamily)